MYDARSLLLNLGHTLDHWAMLIFPTAVLALGPAWNMPYAELLPYALGGFIAFGAGSIPAGWLADHWSRRGMMLVFFFGLGGAMILGGLIESPSQMAAALTLIGLFGAIYHPVGIAMLVEGVTDRLGRTLGVNGVAGNLGLAFAALVTGAVIDLAGWRAGFFVPGAVSIALGFAFWRLVPAVPGGARKKAGGAGTALPRAVVVRVFLVLVSTTIAGGVIFNATTIAMPKVFDERLGALTQTSLGVGLLVCLVFVLAAIAQLIVGGLIDRRPLKAVLVTVVAFQPPLLWLAQGTDNLAMLAVSVAMMFFVFGQIPLNDAMVARVTDEHWRARVYALRYVMSFGASATAVPLVAWLHAKAGGFELVFVVLAALAAITFCVTLTFPRMEEGSRLAPARA
ncbi:MAG: MFS transporter [Alphaproteobacteria bacterium]|nr:MFS transporter [Alphaproteobacteria bacterium]